MKNEIALRTEFIPQAALNQIEALADRLSKGGALPVSIKNGSQLAMVLLAGYEAGMRPMESINAFYLVNGRLTVWGDALIRQLKRAGYKIAWPKSTDKIATVKLTDPDKDVHEETFTHEEAVAAGLIAKGGPWKTYEKDMLRWKAIGRAVRFFCPEVLGGVSYLKEEAEDFIEARAEAKPVDDGTVHMNAGEIKPHTSFPSLEPAKPLAEKNRQELYAHLHALLAKYGMPREALKAACKVETMEELTDAKLIAFIKTLTERTNRGEMWEDPNLPKIDMTVEVREMPAGSPVPEGMVELEHVEPTVDDIVADLPPDMGGTTEPEYKPTCTRKLGAKTCGRELPCKYHP